MNLKLIIVELCLPVVVCLGLILAVPHIIAKSIVPALGAFGLILLFYCTVISWCSLMFIPGFVEIMEKYGKSWNLM